MKIQKVIFAVLLCALLIAVSGCHTEPKAVEVAGVETKPVTPDGTEIVLPLVEQKDSITLAKAEQSDEPEMLHFPGKIALPDNETWRVVEWARGARVCQSGRLRKEGNDSGAHAQPRCA